MEMKLTPKAFILLRNKVERYQFEVGILVDKPHRLPMRGQRGLKGKDVLTTYAGTTIRRASRKASGMSVAEVAKEARKTTGIDYLSRPFKDKSNQDILRFTKYFMKYIFEKGEEKRLLNLLQAIVRNPILRGDYGSNSPLTQKIKGFDHILIDTAQVFKNITARLIKKEARSV